MTSWETLGEFYLNFTSNGGLNGKRGDGIAADYELCIKEG